MNCASVEFFFRVSSVCFGCVSCQGARGEGHMAGTEPLLIGIDSLIMKCGICGRQIMVLILARDTSSLGGAGAYLAAAAVTSVPACP